MSNLYKALIFTATPIVLLSLVSVFSNQPDLNKGLGIAWLVAGSIWLVALLTALGFYIRKSKEIARGVLAGAMIGFASLAITVIIFIIVHQTE